MDCKQVQRDLQLFVDAELPRKLMQEMSQQIGDCPHCRQKYENELYFKQLVRDHLFKKHCPTEEFVRSIKGLVMNVVTT